jgi:hypothetical protein
MSYIGRTPSYGMFEKQSFVGNSATYSFALNYPVSTSASFLVVKNGVQLEPEVAYSINYQTISFAAAPSVSDTLYGIYLARQTLVPYVIGKQITSNSFTGDGTTTTFATSSAIITPAAGLVFVDGVQQSFTSNYTIAGANIVFTSAPLLNAEINVINLGTESATIATPVDGTITYAKMNSLVAGCVAQWTTITNGTTAAVAGYWYFVDTTSGVATLTLPAAPYAGQTIRFVDVASKFNVNNFTLGRNGNKIQGITSDLVVSTVNAANGVVWSGATNGWRLLNV